MSYSSISQGRICTYVAYAAFKLMFCDLLIKLDVDVWQFQSKAWESFVFDEGNTFIKLLEETAGIKPL